MAYTSSDVADILCLMAYQTFMAYTSSDAGILCLMAYIIPSWLIPAVMLAFFV